MNTDRRLGRYLGTTFLVVFAGSALSAALSAPIFAATTAETLQNVAENSAQMRWSAMIELFVTSVGIVVLAVLLHTVVRRQNPLLALVALGWWLAEAVTLAVSTVGAFLLIPVSEAYVQAGASAASGQLAQGEAFIGLDHVAWEIHMVFFALGGLIWYSLMYQSHAVPRWLSTWGVLAVALSLASSVATFATDADLFILGYPTGLFELVIGIWLIARGVSQPADERAPREYAGT